MTVLWDEGYGAFLVTGYDEASTVLRSAGWSSDPRNNLRRPVGLGRPPGTILFMDPPEHTRLRRLLSPAFTPRAIERLRPRVAAIVESALDMLDAKANMMTDLAYLIPLAVITELLDVGEEGAAVFLEETPKLVRTLEVDADADDFAASAEAAIEMMLCLVPVLNERLRHPGDDFISGLIALTDGDEGLQMSVVLATCLLLLAAGHETTANIIGNGVLALLRSPEQVPLLAADPARAVEELLRVAGPVRMVARVALTEQVVGGLRIPAGDVVYVRIDAANQDPRRWPEAPGRLDLARAPLPHLAFGAGVHFCLGAALARLEATETLTRLFARFPGMTLATDEIRWRDSTTFHGLCELPVVTNS